MAREPREVGDRSKHNLENAPGNKVGVGGFVGGSRKGGESCGRCGTDGDSSEAVSPGMLGDEGLRLGRERPCGGGILRR